MVQMLMAVHLVGVGLLESAAAVLAGFLAAFINTLAGNGSIISLLVLKELLGDMKAANASNRIGILAAAIVGAATFRKGGSLKLQGAGWLIGPAVCGSILGGLLADSIDKSVLDLVVLALMPAMLALVLLRPERWLKKDSQLAGDGRRLATLAIFFLIGFYGGFIQVGVGILLLAGLVLFTGYNLVEGNAVKVVITLCFTVPALAVFAGGRGSLTPRAWAIGSVMAAGHVLGAFIAARYAARHPRANVWVRRLLVLMILVGIAKLGYGVAHRGPAPQAGARRVAGPGPGTWRDCGPVLPQGRGDAEGILSRADSRSACPSAVFLGAAAPLRETSHRCSASRATRGCS